MKTVIIVHGWDGTPEYGWFPWLKKELESRGFDVRVPQLPDNANPRIQNWVPALAAAVGTPTEQTYLVGHSMGCQTVARYIESLPEGVQIGGAVFVAGFFKRLTNIGDEPSEKATEHHWLDAPVSLDKIRSHLPKSVAIFSDDDPWVPLDNQDDFRDKLGSEVVVEHKKHHFSDTYKELPIVLKKLLEIAGE